MVSSAPSRAGVEGWPGEWKKIARACGLRRSPGLAAVPSALIVDSARPVPGLPAALPFISDADPFGEERVSERCAAVAAAVPYSALQSRGGDGFHHVRTRRWPGERTVFPCTKSAVIVGGALAGPAMGDSSAAALRSGVGVNDGTATYLADGSITRGRPDEPSSTVRDV